MPFKTRRMTSLKSHRRFEESWYVTSFFASKERKSNSTLKLEQGYKERGIKRQNDHFHLTNSLLHNRLNGC